MRIAPRLSAAYECAQALRFVALMLCGLLLSAAAGAEVQLHTFTISGDNGETGQGYFTWDDTVVAPGAPVANSLSDTGAVIELQIEISGGNVIGGTTLFELSDCNGAFLENSPDFLTDINFVCNNAVNSLSGFSPNINYMNDTDDQGAGVRPPVLGPSSSTLTMTPGRTRPLFSPSTVPLAPQWLLLLVLLLPALARRHLPGG